MPIWSAHHYSTKIIPSVANTCDKGDKGNATAHTPQSTKWLHGNNTVSATWPKQTLHSQSSTNDSGSSGGGLSTSSSPFGSPHALCPPGPGPLLLLLRRELSLLFRLLARTSLRIRRIPSTARSISSCCSGVILSPSRFSRNDCRRFEASLAAVMRSMGVRVGSRSMGEPPPLSWNHTDWGVDRRPSRSSCWRRL